jgi:transcription initiation factor TFIIE subunit alpha
MRKLSKFDMKLLAVAYKLTGPEGYAVLEYIAKNGETTDDTLSRVFRVKPNVIRQIIYNLDKHKLVIFRKDIDKKTNWVTFYWKINRDFFNTYIDFKRNNIIEKIRKRYDYEKSQNFFVCTQKCRRYTFDEAMEQDFKCANCGQVLSMEDNSHLVKFLERKLTAIINTQKQSSLTHRKSTR